MKKIEKIKDKIENMDVVGQGCYDDCKHTVWEGNSNSNNGCHKKLYFTMKYTVLM